MLILVKFIKDYGIPFIGVLLLSAFPVIFMYCANSAEADFIEAVEPLLLFCGIGFVLFAVLSIVSKSPGKAALISGIFMLAFTNFAPIESLIKKIFPNLRYWHTLPIVFVLCICAALAVWMFMSEDIGKTCSMVMCLVFGGLTLLNFVTGMPGLIDKIQTENELRAAREQRIETNAQTNADSPNIYLLIFDEYAGFKQMEEYYDYDNAVLKDFLEDNNFTISYDSHNESIMTATILTNLMNLDYIVDNTTDSSEKELLRKNGAIYDIMREHGYDIQIIESGNGLGDDTPVKGGSTAATTAAGEDLKYLIYENTPIYPFHSLSTSDLFEDVTNLLDYLASDYIFKEIPTFTVGYVIFPHTPFLVDENGNPIPSEKYYNWSDNRYYLGQYKYATKQMIKILDNILENDPNSIIILQSDHGARASTQHDEYMVKFPLEIMNNNLSAVYYMNDSVDEIKGHSSVNTIRIILSKLWEEEYEILEVPEDNYKYK